MLKDDRPLRVLYLDFNSYFASVEQQASPELRNRPIAVCPVMADSSFVIAASYEAKAFGIKTGTRIGEARALCPEIELVPARPPLYVSYHKAVIEAAETVLPVEKVCSIDEMSFRLIGKECQPENALQLANKMKEAIAKYAGECLTSSIGIAPNRFLAKLATDLQKPNGLVMIQSNELPDRLRGLAVTEFAGINKKMQARLQAAGIFSSDDMVDADPEHLQRAFGSIIGQRWYYLLRGYDVPFENETRKSLGHSHVLPPNLRTDQGTRDVLLRLAQKAAARLRAENLWASGLAIHVTGSGRSWDAKTRMAPTQDSMTITEQILKLWEGRDFSGPMKTGLVFYELSEADEVTPSLFEDTVERSRLSHAVDKVNQRFGKNKIFLAGISKAKNSAGEKIAFNKTWLFSEGKGDNEWPDTFRGPKQ